MTNSENSRQTIQPPLGPPELASHIMLWAVATQTSADRLLIHGNHDPWPSARAEKPDELLRRADAALMVLAMRNLLRAVNLADIELGRQSRPDIRGVIRRFNSRVPQVLSARDALEHFDDYARGRGRLQKGDQVAYDFILDDSDGSAIVRVGPMAIDVMLAREECRVLYSSLMSVLRNRLESLNGIEP